MRMGKRRTDPERRAQWEEGERALAARIEERKRIGAEMELREELRRERLRRLSFGLLGREGRASQ